MTDPTTANRLTVFLDALRRTRLLDGAQLDAVLARPDAAGDDPKPLAKFLLQAGLLTRHQLMHLAAGRDGELVLGPYRLLEPAGTSDLGATYRAQHESNGRVVALKLFAPGVAANPETIERFQGELDAASPPPVIDAGHVGGRHYLALDHAPAAVKPAAKPAETQVHIVKFEAADDEEPVNELADLTSGPPSGPIRRRNKASGGSKLFGLAAGASMHVAAVALLLLFLGGYFAFRPAKPPAEKHDPTPVVVVTPKPPERFVEPPPLPPPEPGLPALNFAAAIAVARPEPADAPVKVSPRMKPFDGGHAAAAVVAALPDGKSVLSAGRDGQLILWDVESGQKLRAVPTPHKPAALAVNAAGTVAATAGDDTAVRLWGLPELNEVAALDAHAGKPTALAFSPNGRYLLAASDDKSVKLWDVTDRKPARDLRPANAVTAIAVSPDGRKAALGTETGPVLQYDLEAARQTGIFGGTAAVRGVAYSPDGTVLASVGDDKYLRFWDATGVRKQPLRLALKQTLKGVAFAGDGTWAVVCGESSVFAASPDGGWGALDLNEPVALASASPSADGGAVFLGNDRGAVRQLSFTGGTKEQTLLPAAPVGALAKNAVPKAKAKGKTRPVPAPEAEPPEPAMSAGVKLKWESDATGPQHHVEFSRDGKVLLAVGGDKAVRIYDAASGKEKSAVPGVANAKAGACLLPDGSGFIASGNQPTLVKTVTVPADCLVRRFPLDGRQPQVVCALATYLSYDVGALALTANGQYVVTGGPDYTLRVWSARGGTVLPAKQFITTGRIVAVDAHPKTEVFAALCSDKSVAFYRGSLVIKQLSLNSTSTPTTMKFSPDGKYVLICGPDTLAAWDWNAGTVAKQFKSPGFGPHTACWAAGGAAVVATTNDGAVAYDLESGRELVRVAGPAGSSRHAAVSPDGKLIAVSGRGLQVYELDKPLAAADATDKAGP